MAITVFKSTIELGPRKEHYKVLLLILEAVIIYYACKTPCV
jgi:hypothetical protein